MNDYLPEEQDPHDEDYTYLDDTGTLAETRYTSPDTRPVPPALDTQPVPPIMPPHTPPAAESSEERRANRGKARARHEKRKQQGKSGGGHIDDTPAAPREPRERRQRPSFMPTRTEPDSEEMLAPPLTAPREDRPRRERQRRTSAAAAAANIDWIPHAARPRTQQVKPAGGFSLANMDTQRLRLIIYAVGSVMLVVGIIIALNLFKNEDVESLPPDAIWIGTEWTYEERSDDDVKAFANQLKEANIGTIYAWVSWLKDDGTWAGIRAGTNQFLEVQADVQRFVRQFREAYPEAQLFGWVGFPVELDEDGYRLDDIGVQQTVADFSAVVVEELGFDGVFLNVEQVWNNNADDFVSLLIKVNSVLEDGTPIAVAIPPDWSPLEADIPKPPLIRPGTEWDKEFKQRVALLTDQMAIMAYNSGLSDPNDYVEWVSYQVSVYAQAIAELDAGASILIGIPTYDNELPGHNTIAENIPTALSGVRRGIEASGEAAVNVQGVAIYAGWTTDADEWEQYLALWGNRN